MTAGLPLTIGSVARQTPTQLAEAAIAAISSMAPKRGAHAARAYAVGLDLVGRVIVDRPGTMTASEWVMTCTRRSDPDVLADEIREEVAARGPAPKRHVVYAGRGLREAA